MISIIKLTKLYPLKKKCAAILQSRAQMIIYFMFNNNNNNNKHKNIVRYKMLSTKFEDHA